MTRLSRLLAPTLRDDPADAEVVSHKLLVRAGMMRQIARGIYDLLPLGWRSVRRVEAIVRREMDRAGAQEMLMPAVIPAELWQESGRWDKYGKALLRLKDRYERDFCFGPTHEEVVTDLIRREVRSYRDLPKNLYQIQVKFRDEVRPRFGLMRGREFIMKDAYSFHVDAADARREYQVMYDAYTRIFQGCGLTFRAVEADTGDIGGDLSHEFQVLAESGEDAIVSCERCGYAAKAEKAEVKTLPAPAATGGALERVVTPGKHTVAEVSAFLGVPPERFVKTLISRGRTERRSRCWCAAITRCRRPSCARRSAESRSRSRRRARSSVSPARRSASRDRSGSRAGSSPTIRYAASAVPCPGQTAPTSTSSTWSRPATSPARSSRTSARPARETPVHAATAAPSPSTAGSRSDRCSS